ncbi:MAG: PDZ domain-containing protein [Gammaproteobacteria bacterium]|nr:PDZ domain-containing protein [Gammaproteobacteria bacterium]MDH3767740.1 PDZ domain-containing protein [Gammaproteobacteria bacterium]
MISINTAFRSVVYREAMIRIMFFLLVIGGSVQAAEESANWSRTLAKISSGVVSIRVDSTRAFDTDWNASSQATGFVVDAKRGLLLTNRHVVTAGPVRAEAVFINNEEVDLQPVYRDPVHDFGFYRFDPAALSFMQPAELELRPSGAIVGREIRVVGNDAGEKLSILAGTLARLDRDAPEYGRGRYNDFNTFYYQAASSTSGGSSGSPVIDVEGKVVALNAGANTGAASSFFLPLDRVERALALIQHDEPVTRGTLQTLFQHLPFDELRRLGLQKETEALMRSAFPDSTGMLVVGEVVPGGPGAKVLQSGDILVRINDKVVNHFVPLEGVLDDNVGQIVRLEIERGGDTQLHSITVDDLHALSPSEFIYSGAAVLHRLSYQQARHFNMPVGGIYVANPGYMFGVAAIPRGAVIVEFDGEPVSELDDLEAVLADFADGQRTVVRFFTIDDPQASKVRVVRMDRRWFPAERCHRDDDDGTWPCRSLDNGVVAQPAEVATARFPKYDDARNRKMAPSLVMVNFDMPYTVSGVSEKHYHGTGLVVDAERGLVIVDRNTVPIALGDVRLTFAGSLEITGAVEFIHPLHNLAMVSYDPTLIGDTPVKAAELNPRPVEPGQRVWVMGLKGDHKLVSQGTEVASVDAVGFPLSRSFQFRDVNLETISLVNAPADVDGVLVDERGRVVSLWSSFAYQRGREMAQTNMGVPADLVGEFVSQVRDGRELRSLEVELQFKPLSLARKLGLTEEWVRRIEKHDPRRRRILEVVRTVAGSPASEQLIPGDLLLTIDGQPVSSFREVERSVQKKAVTVTIWRNNMAESFELGTVALDGFGIDRVLAWAGALLQKPHRALAAQRGITQEGVYVAFFTYGSPATRYGLWAGRRIVAVDDQPVRSLDDFIATVRNKGQRGSVRLKTLLWNNAVEVITLKLDEQYWPTYELRRTADGWQRSDVEKS